MAVQHSSVFNQWDFFNPFAELSPLYYTKLNPTAIPDPYLVCVSEDAAAMIGLTPEMCHSAEFTAVFSGNQPPANAKPFAAVYSGHQFGVWAGQLGDGRAISYGSIQLSDGSECEMQLKGAGLTPYSRMGDGKAVLRSSIREFLCSEAMHALGIPTTRALCVIGSDETVHRETPETAAVVTRLAPSFIRFGSFEHWSSEKDITHLKILADDVIQAYYPECLDDPNPYAQFLAIITYKTAQLIAHWQSVGFMHGVMNTDNMSVLGLTLDYGPFGFMDAFDIRHICNHTDVNGRYAFHKQPEIGHWNCFALAQALMPLIEDTDRIKTILNSYPTTFHETHQHLLRKKLGLTTRSEQDEELIGQMFALLQQNHADFTLFFRRLSHLASTPSEQDKALEDLFIDRDALQAWLTSYRIRLQAEPTDDIGRQKLMLKTNPKYILRNHLAQIAIEKAQQKDFSEINNLLFVLSHPFDEHEAYEHYADLPPAWANQLEVSCSS